MSLEILVWFFNIGLIIFVFLYLYVSILYEGGIKIDFYCKSWDWINNYWCDLIWFIILFDEFNCVLCWGIVVNFIFCISFILFFGVFVQVYVLGGYWFYVIVIFGIIVMLSVMFIFFKLYDFIMVVIIFSVILVIVGVIYGLLYF